MILWFDVDGIPAPQGSKKHVGNGIMVESSKKLEPWRKAVQAAAEHAIADTRDTYPLLGPLSLHIACQMPRPKNHYRANGHINDRFADTQHITYPDIDKLARSTMDALKKAGVMKDDAQVVDLHVLKLYVGFEQTPGASVMVGRA